MTVLYLILRMVELHSFSIQITEIHIVDPQLSIGYILKIHGIKKLPNTNKRNTLYNF